MFDLGKLREIKHFAFDLQLAIKNFGGYQSYLSALDRFTRNAVHYLRAYTPVVVIHSADIHKQFLNDVGIVRRDLVQLGMMAFASELGYLEKYATNDHPKLLEDALRKFHADMEIVAAHINNARLPLID
ncbi:MAG: hypothetical protein FWH04_06685 [Oscillospiraceae bacterium]|nr:hypothetical protein [Oscillospiraceae bacterium]